MTTPAVVPSARISGSERRRRFAFAAVTCGALCIALGSQAHEALRALPAAVGFVGPRPLSPPGGETQSPAPPASTAPSAAVVTGDGSSRTFEKPGPLRVGGTTYYPYLFEGHVHTLHSIDARHPTVQILQRAEALGLDALIVTDHGSSAALADFSAYSGSLVPFIGRELGGQFGHAMLWNVAEDDKRSPATTTLRQRGAFAHAHGGLLVFAHPGWWIDGNDHDPMEWMTVSAMRRNGTAGEVDAIELWNGVYRTPLAKLIRAWVALLEAGVYVPIVGDSDFHSFGSHHLGTAHNIAWCEESEPSSCLWSAVRAGRLVVTDGPYASLSVNDHLPGSVVSGGSQALRVEVEARAAEGGTLQLYLGKQVVQTLELPRGETRRASWRIAPPNEDSYVRLDIARSHPTASQTPVSLLSNPVLVDVGEPRAAWR